MKTLVMLALLAGLVLIGSVQPAAAQTIPKVQGLTAFAAETNFMSITGFMRWQYFVENNVWISRAEAAELARSQGA